MKKALKWTGIVILTPILLIIILALLLYFPPVQNWAVKHVAAYASEKTGMDITVGHVNLEFPLNLGIDDVKVLQQNDSLPQVKATVADIHKTVVEIQLLPLFHKQIMVDKLDFNRMEVNTTNLIHTVRVKGNVGHLMLKAHGIDLSKEHINVNDALLTDAKLSLELADTVPPDTTPSKNFWKVNVGNLSLQNTDFTLHLPGDTLQVQAFFGNTIAKNGYLDFYKGLYQVEHLNWQKGWARYDNNFTTHTKGFDPNHLVIDSLKLVADSFYYCDNNLKINIRESNFHEGSSGLHVDKLTGPFALDSTRIYLPDLYLKTPKSEISANFVMDMDAFADNDPGKLTAVLHGSLAKQDLMKFMGAAPYSLRRHWPDYPLRVDGTLKGNMRYVYLDDLSLRLPSAFNLYADGWASHFTNKDRLKFDLDLTAHTYNLSFITRMLDPSLMKQISIPSGIYIKGNFKGNGSTYKANFLAKEGRGNIQAKGTFDAKRIAYNAVAIANNFQIHHFVPNQGLRPFTGYIKVKGQGTDVLSPRTRLNLTARVQKFGIDKYNLNHINAIASIANGKIHADVDSHNTLLKGMIKLDALTNTKNIRATVSADLSKADLYRLHIADSPLIVALRGKINLATDTKDYYKAQGLLSDMRVIDKDSVYRLDDVAVDLLTRRDTTHAILNCADFYLNLDADRGYKHLINSGDNFIRELRRQMKNRVIDQARLRKHLPGGKLFLRTGRYNFISQILRKYGYDFKNANIDMTSSAVSGLNGTVSVDSLVLMDDSIRLDTIRLKFNSNDDLMAYEGYIRNNTENYPVFTAKLNGAIFEKGTYAITQIFDKNDKLGLRLPVSATMADDGIHFQFYGQNPILGYKEFKANDDNYVLLKSDGRVSANMILKADDGQGVQLYSDDENADALQDLTLSLNNFDLEKVLTVIPYAPAVSGIMNGDLHAIQTKSDLSVSSDISVANMTYEHCPMGNLEAQFVYMPKSHGTHQVDGILLSEGDEVGTILGVYDSKGEGNLDASVKLDRFPMQLINGFIPDRLFGFRGYGEGAVDIKGALGKLDVNGEVYLDSTYLFSEPYGIEMRFANDPVTIKNSKLLFENFEMYANNNQPLDISGDFDFSDFDNMFMNVRMRAENFQLIDAKENLRSEAYGKAFVNFFGVMNGPVESLKLRGQLDVLGSTDMTYVMRETELEADNQLNELVKFTNFQDSTADVVVERPAIKGFDMKLGINVDEAAHIVCALNEDHSNYIDLMGGGDLRMSYNPVTDLQLTGRYTLSSGEMKYSLPVIPLKTFNIQDGSYIEFTGDPYDPTLHITATENVKATVDGGTGNSRYVDFDCGVKLSQTLNNMGVEFIISSPEDVTVQDELNTMSTEERGKVAITMLASGMYLTDGNMTTFSMNSALASFLNTEINNITGNAMRTLGLDLGMTVDNAANSSGGLHTDYNFRFAKRFWNNRLNFIVGGQVSTGTDLDEGNRNKSFFDKVELEYRLNKNASQYIRAFYDNSTYDWLEGQIGEYGVGFLWRRKLRHFRDIFRFKNDTQQMPPATKKEDSVTVRK